jgi:FkbM family methyltransferase
MNFKELRRSYCDGVIDKQTYIKRAYEHHQVLFEYAELLSETNISQIRIANSRVIFTLRDSGVELAVAEGDTRAAPIDTLNFASYERQELDMHARLVGRGSTVLDIGANIGWFALSVGHFVPDITVHCFEPIPETYKLLAENIELNRATKIIPHNIGLSDIEGTTQFFCDPLMSVNASMRDLSEKKDGQVSECQISTVDSFVRKRGIAVDFIKCDVEGAEFLVLRGATDTLSQCQPILFVEMLRKWSAKFGYHPNDIIAFLSELGYQCFVQHEARLQRVDTVTEDTRETNFFFLHGKKHANLWEGL